MADNDNNTEEDFSFFKDYNSKYNKLVFCKINKVIEEIEKLINQRNIIDSNIKQKQMLIDDLFKEYNAIKNQFISEFEEIKRELNLKDNLDGDTYLSLTNQLAGIENSIIQIEKQLEEKENIKKYW